MTKSRVCRLCDTETAVNEANECFACTYSRARIGMGSWVEYAYCPQVDPELFFPIYQNHSPEERIAKSVCARCDVQTPCLQYALENNEQHGVWGGLNPQERDRLKKKGKTA